MKPALNLARYAWRHQHGDLTAYGTWWFTPDGARPCLVLIPTNAQDYMRSTPAVVTLDQAWIWSEAIGDGARAARTAAMFAHALDLPHGVDSAIRVASIVRDHLGDLLTIKPYEAYSNDFVDIPIGTVHDDHDGSQIGEARITERV